MTHSAGTRRSESHLLATKCRVHSDISCRTTVDTLAETLWETALLTIREFPHAAMNLSCHRGDQIEDNVEHKQSHETVNE